MAKTDKTSKTADNTESVKEKVDKYINVLDDKNKQILTRLRSIITGTDPKITEEFKWGMPSYSYKGLMIYLRASKNHATLGFYNGSLMDDPEKILVGEDNPKMRHIKIKTPEELNETLVIDLVKRSIQANEN